MRRVSFAVAGVLILTFGLVKNSGTHAIDGGDAENHINEKDLERHVVALASDDFGGRKPFTAGETKTVNYIRNEFENMGLEGANNGSCFQEVPLVEITASPSRVMQLKTNEEELITADLSGIVEDAKLFFKIGMKLSMEETFPQWRDGSEFKAIRDKALSSD